MISQGLLKSEIMRLANEVGVKPKEIHLRGMKKKWASCSSKGRLTFDYILLEMPKHERYHIILHELLHLRYATHGKMFKIMLGSYFKKLTA